MRYVLHILGITGQTVFDKGVLVYKMNFIKMVVVVVAITEICWNADRPFENFITINPLAMEMDI